MKPISLNYFIGQFKKMIYVFHNNGNLFDMILITIIQLKIQPTGFRGEEYVSRSSRQKICSEAAAQIFTVSAQNVLKILQNLSMIMKNIYDGY